MGRGFTNNERVRSAAAQGSSTHRDGVAGRTPKLSRRSSQVVVGLTIGAKREKPETQNERAAARKKDKQKYITRIILVSGVFIVLIAILVTLAIIFIKQVPESEPTIATTPEPIVTAEPTIEIVDASASDASDKITSRMRNYIGLIETDLRSYNYRPIKAIIPNNSIREVDIYLEGYSGFFKTTIDRDAGASAEDIDRMLRYLAGQGITAFEYVDVRIDGRAFWK